MGYLVEIESGSLTILPNVPLAKLPKVTKQADKGFVACQCDLVRWELNESGIVAPEH
jgi:hypothetical protein